MYCALLGGSVGLGGLISIAILNVEQQLYQATVLEISDGHAHAKGWKCVEHGGRCKPASDRHSVVLGSLRQRAESEQDGSLFVEAGQRRWRCPKEPSGLACAD